MTIKRQRVVWPALLIVALGLSAIGFAAAGRIRRPQANSARSSAGQNPPSVASVNQVYIRRGLLSPKLAWHLNSFGDRLEKPGRERLTIAGTLTLSGYSQGEDFEAVLEFPDQLRLTIRNGVQTRVLIFDGEQTKASGKPVDSDEQKIIETLVYDSAEHFFTAQMQGYATRFLGARFRMDDGSSAKYSGPYYDIYQVSDQIKAREQQREQTKFYYFNSDTLLLERVAYQVSRDGSEVKIEDVIGGWQKDQGQQVARTVERFENGKSLFVLAVRSVGLGARANDGTFK